MTRRHLVIQSSGLVTSVGLSAASACAAFRSKLTNPVETRFIDSGGKWIMAHAVPLDQPLRGRARLARMAAMAIEEALAGTPRQQWAAIPLLLCVAEPERPGRLDGLDDKLPVEIARVLGANFSSLSRTVPHGRVAVAVALSQARDLIQRHALQHVLIACADSLLSWQTLSHYERGDRLLTERNSNGFMPGEGAAALLVGPGEVGLCCEGIGFADELAHIDSELPLRADGLAQAIRAALSDAQHTMHELDFRITDLSGEHYYFKEAALALSRTLHTRKEEFDIWHPAECTGETGSVAGGAVIALAKEACHKRFGKGHRVLAHFANDGGRRAAICLRYREG